MIAPSAAPPPTFAAVLFPRELPTSDYVLLTSGYELTVDPLGDRPGSLDTQSVFQFTNHKYRL
jgi:hypothetical protein